MSLAAVEGVDVRSPWHARVLFAGIIVFWTLMTVAVMPWQPSTVERGLALFNQGKYTEALEVLTQAIKEDPANIRAWNGRGMVKRRLKDLDGAWNDLTKAIELFPRYASAHNNRGRVRADRGDFKGAIADYDRAIEFNPTLSTPYNNRGVAKSKLGDYAGAIADYTRAIELAPKDAVPYANRAADLNRMGDVDGARQDVETALALNPAYPFALEVQKRLDSVEPPKWTLDKAASQRIADPCGPGGASAADDPPLPPAPTSGAPDLRDLETTLARSINRLDRTQYLGAVSAAMQATRILTGPLTPAQEQKVFAAWAPLFDYPTDRVLAYLDQLNPLLVEFIALMRGVEAAEAGLEQAQSHAKGYLKFSADAEQTAAYASTDRLHTARVLQDFKQDLQANGFDLAGLQFQPIRNAGNTTPGMDLDLALSTKLTRIAVTDPKTQQVSRLPLYEANARMQEVFDRTYARLSGGRSARASWQMVTTSKHLEAYQDLTWLRLKPGAGAGPVDPLSALDPRYAADAARVTEIKADEVTRQSGMTRDNRNWEIYRGTSKDITTKVLPLIAERLKTNLTPVQRQQILQRQEFYTRLSRAMDLANHDPVAAERALYQLTGHQGAELARMVSMGIASLGTFRRP